MHDILHDLRARGKEDPSCEREDRNGCASRRHTLQQGV